MANTIQIKRGAFASLPTLAAGELGWCTDTFQTYIGTGATNHQLLMYDLYDANTFLYATSDNVPTAKTRAETLALLSGQASANFSFNSKRITNVVDPDGDQDAATKIYVDSIASGLNLKASCRLATVAALPACTAAGTGVGKTLTINAVGILTIDGVNSVLNDRILVKDQAAADDNGIYLVTTAGTAGAAAVLTRATDFDTNAEVTSGSFTFITEGSTLDNQGWILTTSNPITVDTTSLAFTQFSGAGLITAGAGMTKTGNTINLISTAATLTIDADNTEVTYGTGANTACQGNDARLSDARNPNPHKDNHDPNDGIDALDTAAAAEISVVVAAGIGSSHSFSRADHVHAISHAITDNHIVTIDGTSNQPISTDYAKFTANGLEGASASEVLSDIDGANSKLSNLEDTIAINKTLLPGTSDAVALGSTTKMWSDLFLGSGGVINFNNGNVSVTHAAGQLGIGAANLIMTGYIGRDSDNYIGWGVDNSLAIKINGTASAITGISTGVANNDKLVTKGYVDDAVDTVDTFIELTDVDEANYTGHAYDLVRVNAGATGLEFMAIIDGGAFA